uniref:Uncharacterized protein n=1 Tax=Oryza nivara TaxID=4536 RepID=A0A0E0HRF4_ORYNI
MDKVWKSKEKAQMTNLQEGQLHAAQLEDGPLFGPMFVGGPDVDVDELPDASLGALVLEGVHVRGVDVHKVD